MCKSPIYGRVTYYDNEEPHCFRCKQPCKVVHDCYEDDRGRVPFTESDCCGAPVKFLKRREENEHES